MGRAVWIALLALLAAPTAAGGQTAVTGQRRPPTPVVVELFTAQGCTACPDANVWAARIADRENLIVLTYPVDYWDYLGWRDTLAHPAFTNRQRMYKQRLGLKDVYTPQVVVDGRAETAATDPRRLMKLIGEQPNVIGPRVSFEASGQRVFVAGGREPDGGAEAWLIRYDPALRTVAVRDGENKGAQVQHRNTVRELVRLGPYTGRPRAYALPPPTRSDLRTVVVVQSLRQGVLAAGRAGVRAPAAVAGRR
jgi:hypothetical protein